MEWQVRATSPRGAVVTLGADDRGGDIMDVVRRRLPAGEWDVEAAKITPGILRRLALTTAGE